MTNIFIDIEGTVIDDLINREFLTDNCEKIEKYIKAITCIDQYKFGIFTWGWFSHEEIDNELIDIFSKKFGVSFSKVITQKDSLEVFAKEKRISNYATLDVVTMYDNNYTKEQSFIDMFSNDSENVNILIDDCITKQKIINVIDTESLMFLLNPSKLSKK